MTWEKKLVVGPIQSNCWVLRCPRTGDAAVIDPGDDAGEILAALSFGTSTVPPVRYLLFTHGHFDHLNGASELKNRLVAAGQAPVLGIHKADEPMYLRAKQYGALFGIPCVDPPPVDLYLDDRQELRVGELRLEVLHTPGHSPGGCCFRLSGDDANKVRETVYSGDTLFREAIGRTDLPGGNYDLLIRSIREKLLVLDDRVRVCPGHGSESTVGHERAGNPFLI